MSRLNSPTSLSLITPFTGLVTLAILALAVAPASAQIDPDPLAHVYVGELHVQVMGAQPFFMSSAQMDVEVGRDGIAIISAGELSFSGTMDLEDDCFLERSGTWEMDPYGHHLDGPPEHLAVGENTVYSEHLFMECPPPVGVVMDETIDDYWDGGLVFDWVDATTGEAVLTATNELGDTVTWTLWLLVQVPNEKTTWSVLKARYRN